MAKNLIIVESPTKAKSIRKMVGSNYKVVASVGHVRDLPKSTLGVDIENNYEPKYINIRGKGDLIKELKKEAKNANKILLATDPDREGEAISWHLSHILNLDPETENRVSFNEITKETVKKEIKNPRKIDMDLVDAQQARRVMDRLVGYKISPLLWKKVKSGLSAGRVQSVVLKLIVDREEEIANFIPQEYWTIIATIKNGRKSYLAKYYGERENGKDIPVKLSSEEDVDKILKGLEHQNFTVDDVKKGKRERKAQAPFKTSTMQQEASRRINFQAYKTMRVAQSLYEGIRLPGEGSVGLITYMRTDSTRVSAQAVNQTKDFLTKSYGTKYTKPNPYSKKVANSQDAHECIRPTDVFKTPDSIKNHLSKDEFKLYNLIWRRFVASQMPNAIYQTQKITFLSNTSIFRTTGSTLEFDGFLKVYPSKDKDEPELPSLNKGDIVGVKEVLPEQHFTQPPARYNEASLIKLLEELGIGRPSTYSSIVSTLLSRYYVVLEDKKFVPTELGETVNDILVEYFPLFVDEDFTAKMESDLDEVSEGDLPWKELVDDVYTQLDHYLEVAQEEIEKVELHDEETDIVCDKCGRNMVVKMGRFGKFLACPGFPACRNTLPFEEKIDVKCPNCQDGEIVVKRSKKGRKFYGCNQYPKCDFVSWNEPINQKCPKCGDILTRVKRRNGDIIRCHNEKCDYTESV